MAVIVYTTPTCRWCKAAKTYLSTHKVPYREVDLTRHPEAVQDVMRKTGQTGVPVIVVNGRAVVGFDRPRLAQLLGLRDA
ncbi:NrdH-redoxin [Candidatus Hydrogenisulfobacillus filiaventi]|uniref:NrdH-redoxin n=1 Tax=Candidatus Hydrogenisulfobacillus filiaventi TaxID=2707344 RepID=A0A6F8ZJ60_9FIRM|nr:NrdH-redoxin [Candidatus Hydrogenisulfobacillus filiaventi]